MQMDSLYERSDTWLAILGFDFNLTLLLPTPLDLVRNAMKAYIEGIVTTKLIAPSPWPFYQNI
jgi:hypothetical protein